MRSPVRWFAFVLCGVVGIGVEARAQAPAAPPEVAPAPEAAPPPPPPPPPPADMALPPAPPPPPAPAPAKAGPPSFKIEIAKTETLPASSIKVGLLVQPQFQMQQPRYTTPTSAVDGWGNNFFLRRTRILVGGTLFGVLDYFVDTDIPNLGLPAAGTDAMGNPTFLKSATGLNIQDAFITYKPMADLIKIDAGFMLPPLAHNAVQGATTLYSWDYFANSFRAPGNGNFGFGASPVGRDTGVQARGLVAGGLVEYRVGLFNGYRQPASATDSASRNFFRAAGRLQLNLFDPETGFFYQGTYLGTKKILSIGATFDIQDEYKYFGGDVFADIPLEGNVFTAQVNAFYQEGKMGGYTPVVPKNTTVMAEVGFLIGTARVSPIVRFEYVNLDGPSNNDLYAAVGAAWWPYNHNSNLKLFGNYRKNQAAEDPGFQVNLQWQLYFF